VKILHTVQAEVMGNHRPPGTLIPVSRLALPGMLIEIEATAVLR
jgi:enamine deaminase RidA (YjgF/YER057c/UK114 family)